MELILATHNLHKIREFREMLKTLKNLDIISLLQFPTYKLPPETGATFEENARIKAQDAAKELNYLVLADDSGLVVPSLNGQPGIHSKRYAGEEATDAENRIKLLNEMKSLQGLQRSAYYECCLVLANPSEVLMRVSAKVEGRVAKEERGRNGFGYDSIFVKNDYEKSFGELDEQTKNRISHRKKAITKLEKYLVGL